MKGLLPVEGLFSEFSIVSFYRFFLIGLATRQVLVQRTTRSEKKHSFAGQLLFLYVLGLAFCWVDTDNYSY